MDYQKYFKVIPYEEKYKEDVFDVVITSFNSGKSWDDDSRFYEGQRLNENFFNYIIFNTNNIIFLLINQADTKLIGTVMVSLMKECFWTTGVNEHFGEKGFVFISMLAIHPEYQSIGLGRYLMSFSETFVKTCKAMAIALPELSLYEEILNCKFNYDNKSATKDFVTVNQPGFSRVEKMAVQFNNGRESLIKFYKGREYREIGCYQDSKDIVCDPKKTYITKVLREFRFIFAEKNIIGDIV